MSQNSNLLVLVGGAMFIRLFDRANQSERRILIVAGVWLVWLAVGIAVWLLFPLSSDATSHGYESFAVLLGVVAAQVPFSLFITVASVVTWHRISGNYRFVGCLMFLVSVTAALALFLFLRFVLGVV